MRWAHPLWPRGVCALVFLLLFGAAHAGQLSTEDTKALRHYSLSVDKIHRYGLAQQAWNQAKKTDPRVRAEGETNDESQASLADLRAKIARRPRTYAFFKAQGLSEDDVILIPLTCMYASAAAMFSDPHKVPPEIGAAITPAQVKFVRQHKSEVTAAGIFISN